MSTVEATPGGGAGEPSPTAAAAVFSALGDPTRLRLVDTLSDGEPRSISRLTADFEISRQAVSKHLGVLADSGLVTSQRVGREKHYSFSPDTLDEARAYLDTVSRQWDDALGRLRAFVDG